MDNNLAAPFPIFDSAKNFFQLDRMSLDFGEYPELMEHIDTLKETLGDVVEDDLLIAKQFFWSKCRKSTGTYNAYRTEVEKLLLWAWHYPQKSLAALNRVDFENYVDFSISPPDEWIGKTVRQRFLNRETYRKINPEWRPFVNADMPKKYRLSQKSINECYLSLNAFLGYLLDEQYVISNPILSIKKSSPYLIDDTTIEKTKRLSQEQWDFVLDAATAMADRNSRYEIHLFVIAAMKTLYLRVSELSVRESPIQRGFNIWTPTMGDFFKDRHGWWFMAFGKGNKKRKVTVPDDFLPYLKRYRMSRDLTPLPYPNEDTPLLEPLKRHNDGLKVRAVRDLVTEVFNETAMRLKEKGYHEDAAIVGMATTHWLRHTGASIDIESRDIKDLAADLGHSQISTTDKEYIHSDDSARAESGRVRKV